ncbi:MAG: restriction endonuclease subunit S [Firmicutes bacterium]|nr:restriction endonuclease subunit S [Bacillota bacterium]
MKYGLSEKQLNEIINFIGSYPEIEEAVLFGSRAMDTYKEASDVDIALKGERVTASLAAKLKFDIEEDTYLPFFFDFVAYPTITNEALKEHIDTKGVSIFRKGWRECKLGELISEGVADLQTGPCGTMFNASEYTNEGIPLIAVQDIGENKIVTDKLKYVGQETVNRLSRYSVIKNDIIFGRKDSTVRRALITEKEEGWIQGSDCIRLRFYRDVDAKFISYQLGCNKLKDWLIQHSHGATMSSLNQEILSLLPLLLPSLSEQRAIASVLSSIDDKIDLLHRQNKTLEAMAETLFRQWFVEEADEGWEEGSLLELIQLVDGGTPKTSIPDYWDGDILWLAGGDIASNHKSFVLKTEKTITEKGLKNSSAKLLPKFATIISARGMVGKYCLLAQPMAFSQFNYGILPKVDNCYFFTYLLINHLVEKLQSSAYGSVFDTITTTTFKENRILIPTKDKIIGFETAVFPYFNKMFVNKLQIHTLEKLRDTLLPKLMSGEVRVKV